MIDPGIALFVAALIIAIGGIFLWPDQGLLARWRQARWSTARVRREDMLKYIYQCEIEGRKPLLDNIAGILQMRRSKVAELVATMQVDRLIELRDSCICLTPSGRGTALHILRAHRLWERHLADETGFAEGTWHRQAEEVEHRLSPTEAEALSASLGSPTHDPHGDPIPTAGGLFMPHQGQPLTTLALDTPVRIVHLEDEPVVIYAQLVAEGLYPGMVVRVTESTPEHIRFWSEIGEHMLAPIVAANISIVPLATAESVPTLFRHLDDLAVGETAHVLGLSPRCRGAERHRLMDLGILPGIAITAELKSPNGDPTAYRIRDSLIALRRNQAALVNVRDRKIEEQNGEH